VKYKLDRLARPRSIQSHAGNQPVKGASAMALKDGKQYMASLEALELKAHVLGKKQERLSP
jgi:hypothetical protein